MTRAYRIAGIYIIKNRHNGKVYVGSAADIRGRWSTHRVELNRGDHHSRALQRAWNKYGQDSFEFTILEQIADVQERLGRETQLIAEHRSADGRHGYNCLAIAGSGAGYQHTEEAKLRMSESQLKIPYEKRLTYCVSFAGRKHTDETKLKMSASSKRVKPTAEHRAAISERHKGKTISAEHRAISAERCRKRNSSPEHIAKVSAALRGRRMSDEQKAKLSAACKGRKMSEETRAKIAASLKGRTFTPEHLQNIAAAKAAKAAGATA